MAKEEKIRSLTRLYYSNPQIQEIIFNFSKNREAIPRYREETFGKRPDNLQYPSDIINLVNKGATSFHVSEEIWKDPLQISSNMSSSEISEIRKSWDLLLDIDSPFFDYSKIAAKLLIEELEKHGIENYGIKFSGSKGFHIIVPATAFPKTFNSQTTKDMFPDWPRAISQYLMYKIRSKYNKEVTKLDINFKALHERTKLSKEDITEVPCPNCDFPAKKGKIATYKCSECSTTIERKNHKLTKRKLTCIQENCPGYLEIIDQKDYFYCDNCKTSSFNPLSKHDPNKKVTYTTEAKKSSYFSESEYKEEITGEKIASLDLVLVAPRHLFRSLFFARENRTLKCCFNKKRTTKLYPKKCRPTKSKNKRVLPKSKNRRSKTTFGISTHMETTPISRRRKTNTKYL